MYTPLDHGLHVEFGPFKAHELTGSVPGPGQDHPSAQSLFACSGCYPSHRGLLGHVSRHYPAFIAHTGSCARPKRSARLRSPLLRTIFAGCRHSLLRVGPSRRYLCESFPGCLDPYPGASSGALTHFFPEDNGLRRRGSGSAHTIFRTTTSVRTLISGLQSFANVQASGFARHPGRSHRGLTPGSCGFYVPAYLGSLPPRAGDMLAVRIEQLTAWGLSPHKIRSLVGCSPTLQRGSTFAPLRRCCHAAFGAPRKVNVWDGVNTPSRKGRDRGQQDTAGVVSREPNAVTTRRVGTSSPPFSTAAIASGGVPVAFRARTQGPLGYAGL